MQITKDNFDHQSVIVQPNQIVSKKDQVQIS